MDFNNIPLMSMLKDRLGYLNERQKVIAENVANSDTPGYVPSDLQPFTVSTAPTGSSGSAPTLAMAPVAVALTNPAHLSGSDGSDASGSSAAAGGAAPWKAEATPDSETRLDGNQVVLEEEMMKMNDARMNYNAAIGFYEQSMSMIQTAIRIPGKG